ncbi:MAG: hypothetical protein GXP58_05395 [Deltaproteobacteria bacterium]|nr:hypothetical protein [Deltaproteobacteria bacterium]
MSRKERRGGRIGRLVFICISLLAAGLIFSSAGADNCYAFRRLFGRFRGMEKEHKGRGTQQGKSCDSMIPAIIEGYGTDGPWGMETETITNPLWSRKKVSVFFPRGMEGKTPVIFFSHGFGATDWRRAYEPLIRHMVSRGYIVIYSPYPTIRADIKKRYKTLWKGFELAVKRYDNRMDLTHVVFAGHSFGGGATPAMAYKGLVEKGWGRKGALLFIMAPWYSFDISPEKLRALSSMPILTVIQVYDRDQINDHRMAIDIYRNMQFPKGKTYFQVVRSLEINGCKLIADHATPGRNPSIRLKQYTVFKAFDAAADYLFHGKTTGEKVLEDPDSGGTKGSIQPILPEQNPEPEKPEDTYRFPWHGKKNPRIRLEKWR